MLVYSPIVILEEKYGFNLLSTESKGEIAKKQN